MGDSMSLGIGEIAQLERMCISMNFGGGNMILPSRTTLEKMWMCWGYFELFLNLIRTPGAPYVLSSVPWDR